MSVCQGLRGTRRTFTEDVFCDARALEFRPRWLIDDPQSQYVEKETSGKALLCSPTIEGIIHAQVSHICPTVR